jgi:hypothetical protein
MARGEDWIQDKFRHDTITGQTVKSLSAHLVSILPQRVLNATEQR